MMTQKKYSKKQIIEAISYWTKLLKMINESEDMVTDVNGVTCSSLRDYVFEDFEENGPNSINMLIKCEEIRPFGFSSLSRLPINGIDSSIYDTIKTAAAQDTYRVMCYYAANLVAEHKWQDALSEIDINVTFDEYVDLNSEWSLDYGFDAEFAKTFKTEADWNAYKQQKTFEEFKSEMSNAAGLAYQQASDNIFIDDDGIPYCFILWRA